MESKELISYFDLNKELNEDLIRVIRLCKSSHFLETRKEFIDKLSIENSLDL